MDWLKIAAGAALVAMFIYILPAARRMVKNSPKGSASDWMGFVVPLIGVLLVVIILISLV